MSLNPTDLMKFGTVRRFWGRVLRTATLPFKSHVELGYAVRE